VIALLLPAQLVLPGAHLSTIWAGCRFAAGQQRYFADALRVDPLTMHLHPWQARTQFLPRRLLPRAS
jgi:hypothetical protein